MGACLCLSTSAFEDDQNMFQTTNNNKTRNASKRHCSQESEMFRRSKHTVHKHNHIVVYGLRKGSATHAAMGTTCPPHIPPVALHEAWCIGKVLDAY